LGRSETQKPEEKRGGMGWYGHQIEGCFFPCTITQQIAEKKRKTETQGREIYTETIPMSLGNDFQEQEGNP